MKKVIRINGVDREIQGTDPATVFASQASATRVVIEGVELPFTAVFAVVFKVALAAALIGGLMWGGYYALLLALGSR